MGGSRGGGGDPTHPLVPSCQKEPLDGPPSVPPPPPPPERPLLFPPPPVLADSGLKVSVGFLGAMYVFITDHSLRSPSNTPLVLC